LPKKVTLIEKLHDTGEYVHGDEGLAMGTTSRDRLASRSE